MKQHIGLCEDCGAAYTHGGDGRYCYDCRCRRSRYVAHYRPEGEPWEVRARMIRECREGGEMKLRFWPFHRKRIYQKPAVTFLYAWEYDPTMGVSVRHTTYCDTWYLQDMRTQEGAQAYLDSLPCKSGYTDPEVWRY